jgi:hypothetical protein
MAASATSAIFARRFANAARAPNANSMNTNGSAGVT